MPKVYIEMDYAVVEQAIKAQVPAAVEDILRRYDLQRIVEQAITCDDVNKKVPIAEVVFPVLFGESRSKTPKELFEASLHEAVNEALKSAVTAYLHEHPELLMPAIQKALPRALATLKIRLVDEDDED